MKTATSTILIVLLAASHAQGETWVCDARAATGFSASRGYSPLKFDVSGTSFVIRANPDPMSLSLDSQRQNRIFNSVDDSWQAGSIQKIGDRWVELCAIIRDSNLPLNTVTCDTIWYGDFTFNIDTGIYSRTSHGFEIFSSSQSLVEVGECRRTD